MKKKGISLILLVITIIIIIIIAGAVLLNLNKNNPADRARAANVQQTRDSLKSGINLYLGKILANTNGKYMSQAMLLGKVSETLDYSLVVDYGIKETIRGNLDLWQLDYTKVKDKVNLKLDIYDNNSRWYVDEWGNPYLAYKTLASVSPYLKTEDGTKIHPQVEQFVVVIENLEFAEDSTIGVANKSKASITNTISKYLASQNIASTTLALLTDSTNGIASASTTDTTSITVNDEEITLYKIDSTKYQAKTGVSLPETYESSDWYLDKDANIYLIYDEETDIPENMSNGVSTSSYVTSKGGTITAYTASNNSSQESQSGGSSKQDGSITLSSTKGALTYGNSVDILVTTEDYSEINVTTSDDEIATASLDGNTVTITALSKAGDATITITGVENSSYNEVSEEYKVSVWSGTGAMPIGVAKATINSSNIASYIGTEVNYHPSQDSAGVYRVFYLDIDGKYDTAGTLFLRRDADSTVRYENLSMKESYNKNRENEYSLENMEQFNRMWKENDDEVNMMNEFHSAYLCTKSNWSKFADTSKGANYAIGTPSIELFVDAYNQWNINSSQITLSFNSTGYNIGGSYSSLNSSPNNIFNTPNKAIIASPRDSMYMFKLASNSIGQLSDIMTYSLHPIVAFNN